MNIVGVHPYADKFPMLSDGELDELAESIKTVGLLHPMTVTNDGLLLDGRNRLEACNRAGIEARTEVYAGDDFAEFVIACNVGRRHMSTGARAMSTALVLAADGRRKDNGRWERHSVHIGESSNIDLWRKALNQAGVVLDFAPDLASEVVDGTLALDAAFKRACENRDYETSLLEEEKRAEQRETDARTFLEAKAPDYLTGNEAPSVSKARWEADFKREAATARREAEEAERAAKAERDIRYSLYTGCAQSILPLAAKRNIPAAEFMDGFNAKELADLNASAYTADKIEGAISFLTDLLEWTKK
ncbi:ParB N-terminal domain-containing protein [Rhodococcus sp. (in: high G+C Gram-positive bacteria)]|uniref:ParB N-terminal domain-containing protein n=1 Tax=Rhodococcus sp. TaxID=1831 RepID=UPI001A1992D0|nr:ParB N-terminal domain-containing protein [Rhodococcus sp. (in: high G+C Gram-positive bacteria)]MBJ7480893.1 ParB N-terminal domain-containing protein [Rhodococcus sp. (in: high G+C Gram-positive bacteria)]